MPDWANCVLIVAGETNAIDNFVKGIKTRDNGDIDLFGSYIPLPEIFKEIPYSSSQMYAPETVKQAEAKKLFGVTEGIRLEEKHWGVKWGDCNTKVEFTKYPTEMTGVAYTRISTQFPWSEPYDGMLKLSKRFPKLKFNATYLYETNSNIESYLYIDGDRSYGTQSEMSTGYSDDEVFEDVMNFEEEN